MKQDLQSLLVTEIISGLAHNINTPLNLILGYTQQLQAHPEAIGFLDKILESGLKIDDTLRACLDNLTARKNSIPETIDFAGLIRSELAQLINDLRIKRGLNIQARIDEEPMRLKTIPAAWIAILDSLVYRLLPSAPLVINLLLKKEDGTMYLQINAQKNGLFYPLDPAELVATNEEISHYLDLDKQQCFYSLAEYSRNNELSLIIHELAD